MPKNNKPPPQQSHEPTKATRDTVTMHTAVGTNHDIIAGILGITKPTLHKYYRKELDEGMARANAAVGSALFNKAKGGDTASMIFWMKTRAGWRETNNVELTGKGGGPVESVTITASEFEQIARKVADEI